MEFMLGELSTRIIRVHVVVNRRRTSISLDDFLASLLAKRLGGEEYVELWVGEQARRISAALQSARKTQGGQRVGLSRLVQREAIRLVAREELL